jgi:hypothetical protein
VVQGSLDGLSWYELNREDGFSTIIDGVQVPRKTCLPVRFALRMQTPTPSNVLEMGGGCPPPPPANSPQVLQNLGESGKKSEIQYRCQSLDQ